MPMDAGRDDEVDDGDDQALLDEQEEESRRMDINHDWIWMLSVSEMLIYV